MLRILWIFSLLSLILGACADIDPETGGVAFVSMRLEEDHSENRSASRGITLDQAKTALVVLLPPSQCSPSYGNSSQDMDRALLNLATQEVELVVPLQTQMKLCLYFFSDLYGLEQLSTGSIEAESFGESEVFIVDAQTSSATINVVYWGTFYSTLKAKISSKSSAGLIVGSAGSFKLSDLKGVGLKNDNFTVADNQSHTINVEELAYGSYTYEVEMNGFSNEVSTFLVGNAEEVLDIKLTPNPVNLEWISLDNLTVSQLDTSPYAKAQGVMTINVPIAKKDHVTQLLATMVIKNTANSVTRNVTPAVNLPTPDSINDEYVIYKIDFSTPSIDLQTGTNDIDVILSIGGKSLQKNMGSITYDSCIDTNKMCVKLTWTNGTDPDLHACYWSDWSYEESLSSGRTCEDANHVYGHPSYQKYLATGDLVHLQDSTTLPSLKDSSNSVVFTLDSSQNELTLQDADFGDLEKAMPVIFSTTGSLPGGLLTGIIYYIHDLNSTNKTLKLADSSLKATLGTTMELSDVSGSGTQTLTAMNSEMQVWSTNAGKVGDGTYLFWVEDIDAVDLKGVRLNLTGPGLSEALDLTYGPFNLKNDNDNSTVEAPNTSSPYQQATFFIQVHEGKIKRSDNISIGQTLNEWDSNVGGDIGVLPKTQF